MRSEHTLASGSWRLRPVGDLERVPREVRADEIDAIVPGCVHTDLLRAGLIAHPDDGLAERDGRWIGRTDWRYGSVFTAPPAWLAGDRLDLVCDGLDTIASVTINGVEVGEAANMHHPHRFDARGVARAGPNEIAIAFRGPLAYAEEQERARGARPVNGDWGPYAYLRKAACHFGWDWGPCAPSAGIWRDIRLESWSVARLRAVRPLIVRADARRATVDVVVDIERATPDATPLRIETRLRAPRGAADDAAAAVETTEDRAVIRIDIDAPELWWPRGCGAQPLYELTVALEDDRGARDRWSARLGLRSVRLLTTPDDDGPGSAFAVAVNERPIFCRGANWIPDALFPTAMTPARYERRVEQAAAANMNMLRVWGGGIYEHDAFYDACDERGLLVWQDVMLACATYPEEPPYPELIEAEMRHQVTRLCPHASVVLWCGGNENVIAYESWGWKERLRPGQTWGERYYLEILPRIAAELDPTRPFWPDSPWSGARDIHPNEPDRGDRHTWDRRIEGYRDLVPRFVSEFGHQAPPAWATWRRAAGAEGCVAIDTEASRHRQRAGGGNARQYDEPLAERFAAPRSFDEWHYLTQLLQARAIAIGVEWLRAHRPRCMGALIWQLNDVWAGQSWSAIDVDERRKPLWHALRRSFAPRLLTIHPRGGAPTVFAINDDANPWSAAGRARRLGFDGVARSEAHVEVRVDGDGAAAVADLETLLGPPDDPATELIVVDAGAARAWWFHDQDKRLALPAPRFAAEVARRGSTHELRVTAETLLRDLVLAVDRLDPAAEVDDNLVTLLPGETQVFRVTGLDDASVATLTAPPVLQCANRFAGP